MPPQEFELWTCSQGNTVLTTWPMRGPTLSVVKNNDQNAKPFHFHYKVTLRCIYESFTFPHNMIKLVG